AAPAPRDWIAHYTKARNAALAKQWPRAAAHAGIAWVQNPRAPETRALWRLAALEAGVGGRNAGGLPLPDTLPGRLAGQLPPIGWQLTAMAGALLLTGGFGALLFQRFGHASGAWRRPAALGAGLGALGMAAGIAGTWGYGAAAAPDAAITWQPVALRPLPVATPDREATVALAPGTVGRMDGRFIGWVRLTLPDGRSGWLRRGEVIPVWQRQPE
uniref:hypothetical protein n=1 Tax=Sandarakinorhabdus rubra TaxID=2672568 RepID=UPI001969FAA1